VSLARLKRIAALEARRRPPERPWFDPFDLCMRLWVDLQAVAAGKAEWRPVYGPPHWSEVTAAAFERAVRDYDNMGGRLTAKQEAA
jgi:hypothetical protein